MGLGLFRSSCGCTPPDAASATPAPSPPKPPAPRRSGAPNPKRFTILRHVQYMYATVVEVKYEDARNYEGCKIMVYRAPYSKICAQDVLDPHFCDDNSHLSPFARFEPTPDGWAAALVLASRL